MATLIEVLRVANRIILEWYRFGSTQGDLAFPHEPSKDAPPPPAPPLDGGVTVVDSWVLELVVDWEARRRHHAPWDVRGWSMHCDCEIFVHLNGLCVWCLTQFSFFLLMWVCFFCLLNDVLWQWVGDEDLSTCYRLYQVAYCKVVILVQIFSTCFVNFVKYIFF